MNKNKKTWWIFIAKERSTLDTVKRIRADLHLALPEACNLRKMLLEGDMHVNDDDALEIGTVLEKAGCDVGLIHIGENR